MCKSATPTCSFNWLVAMKQVWELAVCLLVCPSVRHDYPFGKKMSREHLPSCMDAVRSLSTCWPPGCCGQIILILETSQVAYDHFKATVSSQYLVPISRNSLHRPGSRSETLTVRMSSGSQVGLRRSFASAFCKGLPLLLHLNSALLTVWKGGVINVNVFEFSLEIDMLLHNLASK